MLNELRGELWYLCSICEVPLKYEILICWAGCMSFSGADKTVILSCSKVMSQNKHLNLWKRACALGVVKGSGVKHAWNFRSGWFWDTMCQNTVGKFLWWYCVFSFFQSQNWTILCSLIRLASLWTYCLINVDIEGEKKGCWKNCFVSCSPTGSHVRLDFNHVVTVALQLCRSTLWLGASLAACFHTCSLACLMHRILLKISWTQGCRHFYCFCSRSWQIEKFSTGSSIRYYSYEQKRKPKPKFF